MLTKQKRPFTDVLWKSCPEEFRIIPNKTPEMDYFLCKVVNLGLQLIYKRFPLQVFYWKFYEFFQNSFFKEHLEATKSGETIQCRGRKPLHKKVKVDSKTVSKLLIQKNMVIRVLICIPNSTRPFLNKMFLVAVNQQILQ